MKEMVKAMEDISVTSNEIARIIKTSEESAVASEELSLQAQMLKSHINKFNLKVGYES